MKYLLILILFAGCTNHAFKVVQKPENKLTLAHVCLSTFPFEGKTKHDTITTEVADTMQYNALLMLFDQMLIAMSEKCKGIDTAAFAKEIRAKIKPCTNKETRLIDTVFVPDTRDLFILNGELEEEKIINQGKEKQILKITAENEVLQAQVKKRGWAIFWIITGGVLSLIGYIYFKVKFKK